MLKVHKFGGKPCYCCGAEAKYSVELVDQDGRIYIPNQMVREHSHPDLKLLWFCHPCMRAIEDAVRATIGYRIAETKLAAQYEELDDSRK